MYIKNDILQSHLALQKLRGGQNHSMQISHSTEEAAEAHT